MPQEHAPEALLSPPVGASWLIFFVVLFASPVCCFIASALNLGILATWFGCAGSLIAGLVCTAILMRNLEVSGAKAVLLCFVIGVLMCGLSYFLSGLGCTAAASITHHEI